MISRASNIDKYDYYPNILMIVELLSQILQFMCVLIQIGDLLLIRTSRLNFSIFLHII